MKFLPHLPKQWLTQKLSKQVWMIIRYTLAAQTGEASRLAQLWKGLQQSFRLMVGVADYDTYLAHMQNHHPELTPMDIKTFYRHCVEARYPSPQSGLKKCPC